jgi:hypothetical protein
VTATPLPEGALTAAQVAELINRSAGWVEEHFGHAGYPTHMRARDRAQWVIPSDVAAWREQSDRERDRPPAALVDWQGRPERRRW